MTIVYHAGHITGVSGDTKPTNVPALSLFVETDNRLWFIFNGSTWDEFAGAEVVTWTQDHNANGNNLTGIQNLIHDISTSGTDINFSEDELQTISISANTTFTTVNRAAGRSKTLKITTDGTLRTLDFPGWDWVSDIPTDQAASKNGYLTLTSYGTTDALIVAAYQVGSL